jgi:intracellular sulfur oxidation DsrE/DsrF family protein
MYTRITDEEIHSYIDDELDRETRRQLQDIVNKKHEVAEKVQNYRHVDQMLKDAYSEVELPNPSSVNNSDNNSATTQPRHNIRQRMIAAVVMPLLFISGWFAHTCIDRPQAQQDLLGGIELSSQNSRKMSAIYHIDVDETLAADDLINRVERILKHYDEKNIEVEVVANSQGLNLLRTDINQYAKRFSELSERYNNLSFVACSNAVKRLEKRGIDVVLVNRTNAEISAVEHVVNRMREGWRYIKI